MKRRRYILLAVLLVLSVAVFQNYYLLPKSETLHEDIQTKYGTLRKYEAFLKGSAITETDIQSAMNDMQTIEKRLVPEKSEFLSSAYIQRTVSELTAASGLNVQNMRPLTAVKIKNFAAMPLYFEGSGTIKQLSDFLKAVESHPVMLKIDKMSINVTNMQNPRDLRFKIQISGLAKT